jgi:predicted peptidase
MMRAEHNRRTVWAMMAALSLAMAPCGISAQAAPAPSALAPGLHALTFQPKDGPRVSYAISIPAGYSASQPVPLILALHFGVGGGDGAGAGGSMVQVLTGPGLAQLGAIIVAPDSVGGNWSTPGNEKAVNALIDMVFANYAIDKKKVAVTGYSMGGTGSWSFGEKFPQRFSAIIPIAGVPPESAAGWKLPVFAIHSRDDQVAPFGPTQARIAELQKAGVNAKLILLTGISHYETDRFQGALQQAVPWLREIWK